MGDPYIGEIRVFAGNFAPLGWALCDGQLLAISENDVLFNLIGTTYGGDGQSNFALPDLRGRFPLHVGGGVPLGRSGGSEAVTLTAGQMPSHPHVAMGTGEGTTGSPSGNFWAGTATLGQFAAGSTANETMAPGAIGSAGGGQPHDNMMPFLALNFIIALQGIFPSQN